MNWAVTISLPKPPPPPAKYLQNTDYAQKTRFQVKNVGYVNCREIPVTYHAHQMISNLGQNVRDRYEYTD